MAVPSLSIASVSMVLLLRTIPLMILVEYYSLVAVDLFRISREIHRTHHYLII